MNSSEFKCKASISIRLFASTRMVTCHMIPKRPYLGAKGHSPIPLALRSSCNMVETKHKSTHRGCLFPRNGHIESLLTNWGMLLRKLRKQTLDERLYLYINPGSPILCLPTHLINVEVYLRICVMSMFTLGTCGAANFSNSCTAAKS